MEETKEQLEQRIKDLEEQKKLLELKGKANKLEDDVALKEEQVNPSFLKKLLRRLF